MYTPAKKSRRAYQLESNPTFLSTLYRNIEVASLTIYGDRLFQHIAWEAFGGQTFFLGCHIGTLIERFTNPLMQKTVIDVDWGPGLRRKWKMARLCLLAIHSALGLEGRHSPRTRSSGDWKERSTCDKEIPVSAKEIPWIKYLGIYLLQRLVNMANAWEMMTTTTYFSSFTICCRI